MYLRRPSVFLSLLLLTSNVSLVDAATTKEDAIRQTYYPEDFSQFVPRSALDLVKQVPGFNLDEGGGVNQRHVRGRRTEGWSGRDSRGQECRDQRNVPARGRANRVP